MSDGIRWWPSNKISLRKEWLSKSYGPRHYIGLVWVIRYYQFGPIYNSYLNKTEALKALPHAVKAREANYNLEGMRIYD